MKYNFDETAKIVDDLLNSMKVMSHRKSKMGES